MNWYVKVLKQYVDFSGRARRTEYWMFTLISAIISIVLGLIDALLFRTGSFTSITGGGSVAFSASLGVLGTIYSLAVLLPTLAVSVRRLHDTDRSGWWLLIGLIPLIGAIVLLVFFVTAGNQSPNRYGPDPKALARGAVH
jgi:uncharacterized membrane protein YhaH (DUF805 family)